MSLIIRKIHARQILDSRGNPTVECDILVSDKKNSFLGRAGIPSGSSVGKYEALEKRDHGKSWNGKSVFSVVKTINAVIAPKLLGKSADQQDVDNFLIALDGTSQKSKLGANATLAVSMALAQASAGRKPLYAHLSSLTRLKPVLPVPFSNVLNGGKHASSNWKFQEGMLVPLKFKHFHDALQAVAETYQVLGTIIEKKYGRQWKNVGDEGGYSCPVSSTEKALELLEQAVDEAGYKQTVSLALDVASSDFFQKGTYQLEKNFSPPEMVDYYRNLIKNYPLVSLEDPFEQNDFEHFEELTTKSKIQIVGDDLTTTNPQRIIQAAKQKSCNCLLLKVNQIGTISEALNAANVAFKNNWNVMVSHRSGETENTFIADLAVGLGSGQIKAGAPCRGERTAKYNQLLRIEEELGPQAKYPHLNLRR